MTSKLAPGKLAPGHRFRRVDTEDPQAILDLTVLHRIRVWGRWELAWRLPGPVLGSVWLVEIRADVLGTVQTLCTPEGLARTGFVRITEEAAS